MNKSSIKLNSFRNCRYIFIISVAAALFFVAGCTGTKDNSNLIKEQNNRKDTPTPVADSMNTPSAVTEVTSKKILSLIDENGTTMDTRIHAPAGFTRIPSSSKELTGFLRGLKLKKAGSKVLLYNGNPKNYQDGHAAVFNLDIGDKDLQQCADSVMRIYAEYYWSIKAFDQISFHLTNGFLMNYTKWRDGYRIVVNGNHVKWSKTGTYDASYEEFRKYLNTVFMYAGTMSLSQECKPVSTDEMLPGDIFLKGGSPGHCVLIVDVAEDKSGNRCFLLAQGYMPAQEFHILKNPLHPKDPWYYVSEITYPLETPEWTFQKGSPVRWGKFPLNEADNN